MYSFNKYVVDLNINNFLIRDIIKILEIKKFKYNLIKIRNLIKMISLYDLLLNKVNTFLFNINIDFDNVKSDINNKRRNV